VLCVVLCEPAADWSLCGIAPVELLLLFTSLLELGCVVLAGAPVEAAEPGLFTSPLCGIAVVELLLVLLLELCGVLLADVSEGTEELPAVVSLLCGIALLDAEPALQLPLRSFTLCTAMELLLFELLWLPETTTVCPASPFSWLSPPVS
jgi:hypothetical protein